jgi:hypothetical protein
MQENIKTKKHYKNKYTTIDNILINDMSLSFQAKGLFLFLWSKPDNWSVNVKQMQHNCIDKQTKIYSALSELEEKGYLIRKRFYVNGKIAGIHYNLSDTKEYFFNEESFNKELLNKENLNEVNQDEHIYIQNKDNNKIKTIQNKESKKENLSLSENPQEVLNRIIERESKKEIREGLNNIFIDLIEKNSLKANDFTELNKTKEDLSKFITFLKESILNLNAQDLENLYNYLVIRKQKHKKLSNTIRTIKATLSNANELKQQKPWINGYYILIKQVSGYAGILTKEYANDVYKEIENGDISSLKVWQELHLDYYKNELKKI